MNSQFRHRFFRRARGSQLAGVCSGVADYFSLDVFWVRMAALVGLVFFTLPVIVAYLLTSLLTDKI